jgi:hypothetical protein
VAIPLDDIESPDDIKPLDDFEPPDDFELDSIEEDRGGPGRLSDYRASQVVPIGAGRETIQRSKLKKRKKASGERKRGGPWLNVASGY